MKFDKKILSLATAGLLFSAGTVQAGELTANAAAQSNYVWRGLTQTVNEAAVSGGVDYAADSGFYVGTWASNVSYAADDVYSYEHDLYLGFGGEAGSISYDVGYLYYNYDKEAEFDFGEVYASIGIAGFTLGLNVLANTEADEAPGQDFGFGETIYVYADYGWEVREGLELGVHVGYHDGDFSEAFNGVPGSYIDYNISLSKGGFSFMISDTDLDDVGPDNLDNDDLKFVVGYSMDFDL
ncbi:MAG: TorF family putative porin [Pseudomonadales bacterium]|nr:TorF family putative porin [Pseudomonadales bacterium]MDG1443585.1 TorF family putative porin [Pseudomonadales bacterium]